jgi:hypothetical protein
VFVPLALTFVVLPGIVASDAKHRGTLVLIEGRAVQIAGLAVLLAPVEWIDTPSALSIMTCAAFLTWMRRVTA